jgi:HK97 family phage major capsid protein
MSNAAPTATMEALVANFTRFEADLAAKLEQQNTEIQANGASSTKTAKEVADLVASMSQISQDLKEVQARVQEVETASARPGRGGGERPKSIGERFVESAEYTAVRAAGKLTTDRVEIGSFFSPQALVDSGEASVGERFATPMRFDEIISPADRPLRLRDLLDVQPTDESAIEFVQETGFTNNAATVAEGALKPESNLTFELKTANARVIAHWLAATRQVLANKRQLQAYIDKRLLYGLMLVEEAQILYGNGTDPNLQGITTHPDIQTYAWSDGQVGDTKLDAIRRAITLAIIANYPVNGVVLHPTDWEELETLKDDNGRYLLFNLAAEGAQPRIWRAPVVETVAMNAGSFLLGAFGMAATLWDLEQGNVRISDSHSDFFVKNKVAILAEERLALTVFRPESFVLGDFDAAPAP